MKKLITGCRGKRITAWLLAAVMALSAAGVMPVAPVQAQTVSSGDAAPRTVSDGNVSSQNGDDAYVLNVENLTEGAISAELLAGTSNYFAIGKDFTVEGNTKTFDDIGITVSKRMKSGGDGSGSKRYIRFTVSGGKQADITVCATSSSGSADAQLVLCNAADDSIVTGTEAFLERGKSVTVTYSDIPSGTYYLTSKKVTDQYAVTGNVNFYYVRVAEAVTVQAPTVNTVTVLQDEKKRGKRHCYVHGNSGGVRL